MCRVFFQGPTRLESSGVTDRTASRETNSTYGTSSSQFSALSFKNRYIDIQMLRYTDKFMRIYTDIIYINNPTKDVCQNTGTT